MEKENCKETVYEAGGFRLYSHQCTRKAKKDGFCKQHHPNTIKEKNKKWVEEFDRQRRKREFAVVLSGNAERFLTALEEISKSCKTIDEAIKKADTAIQKYRTEIEKIKPTERK